MTPDVTMTWSEIKALISTVKDKRGLEINCTERLVNLGHLHDDLFIFLHI